jgi:hypothetical protein
MGRGTAVPIHFRPEELQPVLEAVSDDLPAGKGMSHPDCRSAFLARFHGTLFGGIRWVQGKVEGTEAKGRL